MSETDDTKAALLASAYHQLLAQGATRLTLAAVAKSAGHAKGLVSYHFGSKKGLLEALAERLRDERFAAWIDALSGTDMRGALDRAWNLLLSETESGISRTWTELIDGRLLTDGPARIEKSFCDTLSEQTVRLLREEGLRPRIPENEIGVLVASAIHGCQRLLDCGVPEDIVNGGFTAAWLTLVSLCD